MSTMTVQLDFQDGSSWIDISPLVMKSGFKRDRKLYSNDLKCVQSTCSFGMLRDNNIITKLLTTTKEVVARVYKDGNPYFHGFVRRNFNVQVRTRVDPLAIELIDRSEALKKKISDSFAWGGYKVHTAADTAHSVVHQLLLKAGYAAGEILPDDIDKTIDYFVNIGLENDRTYFDALQKILFEFGFFFYHDESGNFKTYNFLPASLSSEFEFNTGTSGNMIGALRTTKQLWKNEAAEVQWWLHDTLTAATLFNDTTGGGSTNICDIPLASGEYYPEGAESAPVYTEYDVGDREIIYCDSVVLSLTATGGIASTEFTSYFKRALLTIQNLGAAGSITKLKITGRAIVKGDLHKTRRFFVADTEKMRKYEAEYILDEDDAIKLATGLSDYDAYSPFEYAFRSRTAIGLGAIVDIVDAVNLGIDNQVRVKTIVDLEDLGYHDYLCDGVNAYTAADCSSEFIHAQPPAPQPPTVYDINVDTFSAIIVGFDGGGGTTVPTVPSIAVCKSAGPKAITLKWDRQLNLTNFDHYEIQVSANESSWYDLSFDGTGAATGWGDALGEVTAWITETLTQVEIPLGGTSSAPESVGLYYRVRRVTKQIVASDWSSSAFAYAKPVMPGMLAANSIYANNVIASELETILLRADTIYLGYYSSTGGTIDSPNEGDTVRYMTGTVDWWMERTGGAWVLNANGIAIGLFIAGLFSNTIGCGGIYHPANPPTATELLPNPYFRVFGFNNVYTDQNGLDDWATKTAIAFSSTEKKFGTYSLFATAGNQGGLYSAAGGLTASSQSFGVWVKQTATGNANTTAYRDMIVNIFVGFNDTIRIYNKTTNGSPTLKLYVQVVKNSATVVDAFLCDVPTGWFYLGFVYNSTTDIITCIVNNVLFTSGALGGSWSGSAWSNTTIFTENAFSANNVTGSRYLDEALFFWNKYLDPNILVQHYNHGVAWNTAYSRADLLMQPNTDGRNYSPVGFLCPRAIYSHTEAANTNGGTTTTGAWRDVTYNTEAEDTIGASIASNVITLPSGTYDIDAWHTFYNGNYIRLKLYNNTTGADIKLGMSIYNTVSTHSTIATVATRLTIAAQTDIKVMYQCSATSSNYGMGVAVNYGIELYGEVKIVKVG